MEIKEEGNSKIITSVSEDEQEVFRFFSVHSPCWFEGCEELREDFQEDLDRLPKNCPACHKGDLMRNYLPKVQELLELHRKDMVRRNTSIKQEKPRTKIVPVPSPAPKTVEAVEKRRPWWYFPRLFKSKQ